MRVWREIRRLYQRHERWCSESMANRGLSTMVFYTLLWLSSALFWPLPQGRWDSAFMGLTVVALIVLGKAANRLQHVRRRRRGETL